MEHLGKTLESNADSDAFISRDVSEMCAAMYLADTPRDEPLANPLHADFSGFPRLYITAGGAESLLDNATRLHDLAEAAGVDVTLSVVEGQQHVFPFNAGRTVAADDQIAAIAKWYVG
jgi:acetyl esterase/lipase